MKKIISVLCAMAIVFSFSACSIAGLDPQSLISPPQANEDQQAIYQLLTSDDGEMNFIYPKNGDYRSAVIMHDFDGDEIEEAVGLSSDSDGGIEIVFMIKKDGVWETINSFKNSGTQVDKIMFADFSGDGVPEMIVGWGSPLSMTATITIYGYQDNQIVEYNIGEQYNEFVVTDFDADGKNEMFIATVFAAAEAEDTQDKQALGKLYVLKNGEISLQSIVSLNNSVVIYNSCSFIDISEEEKGLVLEGVTAEGSLVNEVLTINDDTLLSPFSWDIHQKEYNYFLRPASLAISAEDIDNDGIIEFPKISLQKFVDDEINSNSVNYTVDWLRFSYSGAISEIVLRNIISTDDNFVLTVPSDNDNIVCIKSDENCYEISEYMYDSDGEFSYKKVYLRLKVFSISEWENYEDEYYEFLLKTEEDKVLAVKTVIKNEYNLIDSIEIWS
ncbi:MAG: hypothetical protein R3Y33_03550 [Clostridia bacterium]